jgi:hypothetical protein
MYNGALADMNLAADPLTGNRYAFGGVVTAAKFNDSENNALEYLNYYDLGGADYAHPPKNGQAYLPIKDDGKGRKPDLFLVTFADGKPIEADSWDIYAIKTDNIRNALGELYKKAGQKDPRSSKEIDRQADNVLVWFDGLTDLSPEVATSLSDTIQHGPLPRGPLALDNVRMAAVDPTQYTLEPFDFTIGLGQSTGAAVNPGVTENEIPPDLMPGDDGILSGEDDGEIVGE